MHIRRPLKSQEQTKQENVQCKTEVEVAEDKLNINTKNEIPDAAFEPFDDHKDIKSDSNDSDFELDNLR